MNLSLRPHNKNRYPISGIFIKGEHPGIWLREIQFAGLRLDQCDVYPLPGSIANSLWGCLVVSTYITKDIKTKNTLAQCIDNKLYLPELSELFPKISENEFYQFFKEGIHVAHPEIGFAMITDKINWADIISLIDTITVKIESPAKTIIAPEILRTFQLKALTPEETMQALDDKLIPDKKLFNEGPLSTTEKIKHFFMKPFFGKSGEGENHSSFVNKLKNIFKSTAINNYLDKLNLDFEELERRNQKEVNKLLEMFDKDPFEALKYAIPLDDNHSSRGGDAGLFKFDKIWSSFSLFGNVSSSSGGGGATISNDAYMQLSDKYNKAANEMIKRGEYEKAAFIYIKLLKNYYAAAKTLEDGKMYAESAAVCLKYLKDKKRAAQCYENGRMYNEAIELYKEIYEHEKVGDLYSKLNNRYEANVYYQKVADTFISTHNYSKAGDLYKNKMMDIDKAQEMLLTGFRENYQGFECLHKYFDNIGEPRELYDSIDHIHKAEINESNKDVFLLVLKSQYKKGNQVATLSRDLAYEIVSSLIKSRPDLINELKSFNDNDKNVEKDISKFKSTRRK